MHQCGLKPWWWIFLWIIPENNHTYSSSIDVFCLHIEIVLFIMLWSKFNAFHVIAYTQKCRNRHENEISMSNVVKVIMFYKSLKCVTHPWISLWASHKWIISKDKKNTNRKFWVRLNKGQLATRLIFHSMFRSGISVKYGVLCKDMNKNGIE